MLAIYKREVRAYFNSMLGWVFIAATVALTGVYFMSYNMFQGYVYFSYALDSVSTMMMILIPILTMRSMSEERSSRTDQLLLTSPVTVGSIVMGKYLAMMTVMAVPLALFCLCPLIIRMQGQAAFAADYGTILAFFLFCGVLIAIGLLVSSLTESQLIAAVGTFGALIVLFLWDGLISFLPVSASGSLMGLAVILAAVCAALQALSNNWLVAVGTGVVGCGALIGAYKYDSTLFESLLPDVLDKFSLTATFETFAADHVFDVTGLLLYISLIALLLFLCTQVLQKRRWS